MKLLSLALAASSVGVLGFVSSSGALADQPVTIRIDGSSTVFPITEAVAEEFQKSTKGKVRATVGISGTGGGFKKFCRGETEFQNASRPIQGKEMEACSKEGITYLEIPVAFDALTVMVSPQNKWLTEISIADLKKIWEPAAQGKILKWSQVNPKWPDEPIKLYAPGADSGTFDYFTEAVVGKSKASRGDYTASEDDNTLVQGISNDKNALGYFGYSYYEPNAKKLKALGIIGGEGAPQKGAVLPSAATVSDSTYFPLSRPLFLYISTKALERKEIQDFANFYVSNAAKLATGVKYVALPESTYKASLVRINKRESGTAFGGHSEVGLHVDEMMKRTPTLKYAEKK